MFLNFRWTEDKLAGDDLLAASSNQSQRTRHRPVFSYAGIDVQADGYDTPVKWNLFAGKDGKTHTSLGLYCPELGILVRRQSDHIPQNESRLWVNVGMRVIHR